MRKFAIHNLNFMLLGLLLVGISQPLAAQNMSSNMDNAVSSLRGRVTSPKVGDFSFFFDQEIRSTSDFGAFKDSRSSLFGVYNALPWLKVSAGYVFMVKEGSSSPSMRHRFILAPEQNFVLGDFKFSLRERLESTSNNGYLFEEQSADARVNLLRTRLKVSYSKGQRAVPYAYTELYNQTNKAMLLTRIRSHAGVEYALTSNMKLAAFYQYSHFTNEPTSTAPHTLGVMYTYSIRRAK